MNNYIRTISILGCGWLGFPLAEYFIKKGYEVRGSTTSIEKIPLLEAAGITPYYLNFLPELEGEVLNFFFTDLLIINIPPKRRDDIKTYYPQQIESALEQAIRHNTKRIIFISSTSVYPELNGIVKEEDAMCPEKPAGKALVEAENILRTAQTIQPTILRFGGLIGSDRNPATSLSRKSTLENGQAPVNLIHIYDCIAIIDKIIEINCWGKTYNACAPIHPTRNELYTHAAKTKGVELPEFCNDSKLRFKIVDSSLLEKELSYSFLYPDPMKMF